MTEYTIDQGLGVQQRMNLLAAVRGPTTLALLDSVNLPKGARCVDLGCGGGHVAMALARRVGPSGSVVGIDLDCELLSAARDIAAADGLDNVEFRVASAEDLSEADFDLAFSRLLFMHLPDPDAVASLMVHAVRPGGFVVVEDAEFSTCFTYPSCPAYDRWVNWYRETVRRTGADADIGPRLPSILRAVHVDVLGVRIVQEAFLDGPCKRLQELSMLKQKSAVISAGLATADEYDAAHADVQAFVADPSTLVAGPRIVQTWGKRPA
jgi:SAM-dependent methyltransferase